MLGITAFSITSVSGILSCDLIPINLCKMLYWSDTVLSVSAVQCQRLTDIKEDNRHNCSIHS